MLPEIQSPFYSFSQHIITVMTIGPRVFQDLYLPRELIHRESEIGQLSRAFQRTVSGSAPNNALFCGPRGVGKTVLARHTHDRLGKRAPVSQSHIRSLGNSIGAILREAIGRHPVELTPQLSINTPVDGVYQLLRDIVGISSL
jgi:Cdc6-like AAA superfamily ATPase